jgi:hypothetical protein
VTLVLSDHLGSYRGGGPFRCFSDQFAEPVPGGYLEPYDLDTAEVVVSYAWEGLASADVLPMGRYVAIPSERTRSGDGTLRMEFGPDPAFVQPLPRRKVTTALWPNAPAASIGRAIPLVVGSGLTVPGLLVDAATGKYLICESPSATPVDVTAVRYLSQDPVSGVPEYITLTTPPSNPVQSEMTGTLDFFLTDPTIPEVTSYAWGLFFQNDSYLIANVQCEIKKASAGTNFGDLILTIEENSAPVPGIPSGTVAGGSAQAVVSGDAPTTSYAYHTFTFSPPVLVRAGRIYWIRLTYRATAGADGAALNFRLGATPAAPGGAGLLWWLPPTAGGITGQWVALETSSDTGLPNHKVNASAFTISDSTVDGDGQNIALVTFGQDLGDAQVVASVDGMVDDGSGTYTGTAAARITKGPDIERFLQMSAIGMGLTSAKVDTAALDTARSRLSSWFNLAGVLTEDEQAMVWLQRVARCCKSQVFTDQDGKLTMLVDGGTVTPVRTVNPWEHGDLELSGPPDAANFPWTRIEVYAKRNLTATAVPDNPDHQRVAEWAVFVSQDNPGLQVRYGVRTNAGQVEPAAGRFVTGGPQDGNTFHFVNSESDATTLLTYLAGLGGTRLDPWGRLRVELPAFARGWRLMDEFELEAWAFPSALGRGRLGEVVITGASFGPEIQVYSARCGRFSVRTLEPNPPGAGMAVAIVAKLVRWVTP